jgi:hypothetical protein
MIEQIVSTDCPIQFDEAAFARWNIPYAIAQPRFSSSSKGQGPSTGEEGGGNSNGADGDQQDAQDVVQSMDDELKRMPMWWILELIPMTYTFQNAQDKWVTRWR